MCNDSIEITQIVVILLVEEGIQRILMLNIKYFIQD